MKPATHAPFFACLYAALCDTAREQGYALTIHGTVTTDLDLVAVPWTPEAVPAEDLMQALMKHIGAVDYRGLLKRDCSSWATEPQIDDMVKAERARNNEPRGPLDCTMKPHGRKAWNLYMEHGCKVDLSVMPTGRDQEHCPKCGEPGIFIRHRFFETMHSDVWMCQNEACASHSLYWHRDFR